MRGEDGAIVAQRHQGEELLLDGPATRVRRARTGVAAGSSTTKIGLFAHGEIADLVGKPERYGAALGGQVEGAQGVEIDAVELENLVGFAQRAQDRIAGAATDIGADPDLTPADRVRSKLKSPLPTNRFEVGQKAIEPPASAIRARSSSLIWMQCAKTERGPTRPARA